MHRSHLPDWARRRSAAMTRFPALVPRQAAVLVVDMQRAFVGDQAVFPNPFADEIICNINHIVDTARVAGALICWSRHAVVEEGPGRQRDWQCFEGSMSNVSAPHLAPGGAAQALHEALHVADDDLVFDKYRFSCFVNAAIDLDAWLRARGIEDIFIVVTISNCCCESTARDAAMRDYRVRFVADATTALTDEEHDAALLNAAAVVGHVVDTRTVVEDFADTAVTMKEDA